MSQGRSFTARAVLAVVLMVLFYALAAGVVVGTGWLAYYLLRSFLETGRATGYLAVLFFACAGVCVIVVWSVLPRFDRFEPPGPEATPAQHPELFVEVERIASATGQQRPEHVYLVPAVNAFVAQRGGIMGVGSRRVMGIGLPLMRSLHVDELRAVLAHEMGHFHGGDTRLGPWIYKTREAVARTLVNLVRANQLGGYLVVVAIVLAVVRTPFRWFLIGYLRVTQAISRAQEHSADAVAVRAEGKRALIEGLKKTHAAALAYELYLNSEIAPLVSVGALPEVGHGFTRFLESDRLDKLLGEAVEHELAEGVQDPYDSHPPLRDRIVAAEPLDGPAPEPDARPAIELVRDPEVIEAAMFAEIVEGPLERIPWSETPRAWEKVWHREIEPLRAVLATIPVVSFDTDLREVAEHAERALGVDAVRGATREELADWWSSAVGAALAVVLLEAGYAVARIPGTPSTFSRGEQVIELFVELEQRLEGKVADAAWRERCEALGIADRMLATPPVRA